MLSSKSNLIYCDWNVLEEIRRGGQRALQNVIEAAMEAGTVVVPFSATHVGELQRYFAGCHPKSDIDLDGRLAWLGAFTRANYLYAGADVGMPELRQAHPRSVYATINEVSWGDAVMDALFAIYVRKSDVDAYREHLGVQPQEISNLRPPNVISQLDHLLGERMRAARAPAGTPRTMREMLDASKRAHPRGGTFGLREEIAGMFTLLNFLGFRSDRGFGGKGTRSAMLDAEHTYLAPYASAFVSMDAKLRAKAQIVYEYLQINTVVTPPETLDLAVLHGNKRP